MKEILAHLAVLIVGIGWFGWVVSTLWAWFVVPLGLQAIGIAHVVGLRVTVRMLSGKIRKTDENFTICQMVVDAFAVPMAALTIGFAAHLWMP